ncbi:MAG: DNA polymerase III subunit delta [Planctomycetes bacterium]|nr:DNA polymerase III subunit delta [Planctomycetota bacterium]
MMKVDDLLRAGPRPDIRVFAVTGDEPFLREQAVRCILDALPEDVELQLVQGTVPGGSGAVELRDLFDDLRMRGLFGGEQLIHLKDADGFVKEHQKAIARFLNEGEAVQRLVIEGKALMAKGRKTVPKTGLLAAVEKMGGLVVACDPLYDSPFQGRGPAWQSPLSRWVVECARSLGKRMSQEDAYVLHRLVGNKLRELDAELRKLATYVKDRPAITADDVEQCVGSGRLAPVFGLADAIAGKNGEEALEQSELLFERGVQDFSGRHVRDHQSVAMMILGAVNSRMRKVARVRELMAGGEEFGAAATAVRQPPMFRDRLRAQVESWRQPGDFDGCCKGLLEVERELKSGGGSPRVLLDHFLVKYVGVRRRASAGSMPWRR